MHTIIVQYREVIKIVNSICNHTVGKRSTVHPRLPVAIMLINLVCNGHPKKSLYETWTQYYETYFGVIYAKA